MSLTKYGLTWASQYDLAQIERSMIQKGGQWKDAKGRLYGNGLFYHYKELQTLLWPDDDHHRWSDLMLSEILKNTITAVLGPKDSSKTRTASKFALTDYFCFPECTLILISSTDLRGLEMRVWGDLKMLWEEARRRFDWIPGVVLESKHAICTDVLEEDGDVRDQRKGIIGIPCLSSSGQFLGLGRYVGIKQKRRRLIGDECFPAGTLVSTPSGKLPIERIKGGDLINNALGTCPVRAIRKTQALSLVRIRLTDGREILSTPTHNMFTQKGWIKAIDLNSQHFMMGGYETLSLLQNAILSQRQSSSLRTLPPSPSNMRNMFPTICAERQRIDTTFLQSELLRKMEIEAASYKKEILLQGSKPKTFSIQNQMVDSSVRTKTTPVPSDDFGQSNPATRSSPENTISSRYATSKSSTSTIADCKAARLQNSQSVQHKGWTDSGRGHAVEVASTWKMELCSADEKEERVNVSLSLQSGRCIAGYKTCGRGRRAVSPIKPGRNQGPEKKHDFDGAWVESCEVLKQADFDRYKNSEGIVEVYNIHVAGHHTYTVNGITVSNCQFMKDGFLEAIANLNSGDFKGVFLGNPIGQEEPLDKVSEPKEGWSSLPEPEVTSVWQNRWLGGCTINLVGTDSPNFDVPADQKVPFPYLINRKSMEAVESFYGKESLQWYSQCKGVRRSGINARRVITRELCEQFHAFDEPMWEGSERTNIAGLDAAYSGVGGDRCPIIKGVMGKDINGKQVLTLHSPVLVPVSLKKTERPEDQIAAWVRDWCKGEEIAPENLFYDSTGRGTLGTAFARLWSAQVEPVEFGGRPTTRPVSLDLFIFDEEDGQRRLKRCDEHYSKFVTELWFTLRYAIESEQVKSLPQEVAKEGYMREWKLVKGDRIEIETKEDTKKRMGRSPDLMDATVAMIEGARRRGFAIQKLAATSEGESDDTWLRDEMETYRRIIKSGRLQPV